uniref:TIL domain-containing protein n=1 Tax=Rhabditophanes sp. KR3021 TaxID=114890 RepID=A0AC35TIM7_9BILA
MFGKIIIVSLTAFTFASKLPLPTLESSVTECSSNRSYTEDGSACQPKCTDVDIVMPCIKMCIAAGWYCNKEGYALDGDDKCILKSDCPRNGTIVTTEITTRQSLTRDRNAYWIQLERDCITNLEIRSSNYFCNEGRRELSCLRLLGEGSVIGITGECIRLRTGLMKLKNIKIHL